MAVLRLTSANGLDGEDIVLRTEDILAMVFNTPNPSLWVQMRQGNNISVRGKSKADAVNLFNTIASAM